MSTGVNYQLTGTQSVHELLALSQNTVVPDIDDDTLHNVQSVNMKIPKFWINHTFCVLFKDVTNDSVESICSRTNILENISMPENAVQYLDAKQFLLGNSVAAALGANIPLDTTTLPRFRELLDIMTIASITDNANSINEVKNKAIETFKRKAIGDDTPSSTQASTGKAHQIDINSPDVINCRLTTGARDAFSDNLAKHMVKYLDPAFSTGTEYENVASVPSSGAEIIDSSGDNVDFIIGQIIKQAHNLNTINTLLGAVDSSGVPVPDLTDGSKGFHFLKFQYNDKLTFKNTVTITDANNQSTELIINFNLIVSDEYEASNWNEQAGALMLPESMSGPFIA